MENSPKLNLFSLLIDTDYTPTAHAFSGVKNILNMKHLKIKSLKSLFFFLIT